ncbi:cellulose binding domain-containing protein [Sphaerisporangium sp. B11E5]|uniref:cellulose binding domain-containing protein n=1 Tax=Sphaerisporangium sp. B11E5 TaxID=3153563 RepID=UPI00325F6E13
MLTALIGVLAYLVVTPTPPARAATVRIMPLGDSITGSPGCWRALLWNRLVQAGYTGLDFVGTLPPQGCGVSHDGDNEGHGGALVTNVADQNQLPGWLSATRPDIVLMHFGTNDVWSNRPTQTILAAYSKLVDQMRASNPNMKILVAQIIPMSVSSCPDCGNRVISLNAAIPSWAESKSTPASPIVVVDQWTGFSNAQNTYDGVHPNAAGDQLISDTWFPPLKSLLDGVLPTPTPTPTMSTTPSPTRPPTPTPTPTPSNSPGTCQATYTVGNSWPGGFNASVTVRNPGPTTTSGWTVRWIWPSGQSVSQAWNATVTTSGSTVTAKNAPYNGTLPAGATTTFGFTATYSRTNTAPTPLCTFP